MKKSIYAIMAAAAIFAGCTQETDVNLQENPGKHLITIKADVDNTKTTVTDAGVFGWQAGETIGVVEQDGSAVIPFSIQDAEEGLFTGTLTAGKEPVFAVSPAAFVSGVAENGGDIEYDITLDNISDYVPGTTNAIMVGGYSGKDGDNYKFHFNHAAALVKVRVQNVPVGTAKVKLTLDKNITGIWEDLSTLTPVLGENEYGEPSLTLTLKKAVTNPNTTADYYFPVPANTYGSFQFELLNADGDRIKGFGKTVEIPLEAGSLFLSPAIPLAPVEIVKGAEWTYTFGEKKYSENGTQTLTVGTEPNAVSMDWTLDGTFKNGSGYWAYDSTKGQQFGSGSYPYSTLTLTADSGVDGIQDVVINTSGASSINATVSVSVGGTPFVIKGSDPAKTSDALTASATEYTFTSPDGELYVGDIVISYANSSSKAIYIKTISLNPDTRIDPELAYSPAAYNVLASSTLATPVLSAVEGFDGTVTYAIGSEDDPEVASVNAETGAVTIGAKAGSVTVTASFAGNATYKPGSASYTITVGAAALSVTEPAAAECSANSTTTFTVTSNVEWIATTDDGEIITSIDPSDAQSPAADPVTVTVTLAANTGAQRTATVKVRPTNQTAYSALNQDVTVTQKLYTADVIFEKYSGVLSGGTYLLVDANANVALRSTISSSRAGYKAVAEYETGKIKNPIPSIVWVIAANGDYWTAYSDTTSLYIGSTSAKNQAALLDSVTDNAKWSVASTNESTTYDFVNKAREESSSSNGNKYLRYNSGYGFACYASGTGTALTLYKLVDNTVWNLKSIAVKTAPTKVTYDVGDHFDPTGLVITATYSDQAGVKNDKTVEVAYSNATAEAFAFDPSTSAALTVDDDEVTITWGEKSTTQAITVNAALEWTLSSIAVKTAPTKVTYTVGEYFAPAGLVLTATYTAPGDNEKTEDVVYSNETAEAFAFDPSTSDALTIDDDEVTITWGGKSTTQAITVEAASAGSSVNNPLTVAEAIEAYQANNSIGSKYVKGIVCQEGNSYCFISDDGTTANKMELYSFSGSIASSALKVGDAVIAHGTLDYYSKNSVYEINGTTVDVHISKPVLTPNGGNFVDSQSVSIASTNSSSIRYTTDGSAPTVSTGEVYSAALNLTASATVKAVGIDENGVVCTAVASATFTKLQTYAVTWEAPANGSITVKNGETTLASGDLVPETATVSITASPADGYALSTLVYNDGSDHDIKSTKSFTMPAHAVSIAATFEETGGGATPLDDPSNVAITAFSAAGFTATWANDANADSYSWILSTSDSAPASTSDASVKAFGTSSAATLKDGKWTLTKTGLSLDGVYYFYVKAVGAGSYSDSDYSSQKVSLLSFESAANTYSSNWTITTIVSQRNTISAHAGSYYANTDGKTSGTIQTANVIENPGTLKFYVSKESTNTNASSVWKVSVKTATASSWTQVGDSQSAASSITKGTWTEVTRDLSSYSKVYVKIEYSGSTAIRAIDDVSLTGN